MSLEQAIQENTAAVIALTVALNANGGKTGETSTDVKTTTTGKKAATTTKKDAKPKATHTPEELKAVLVKYKTATDLKAAKALTKKLGYDSITDVPEDEIDAVYAGIEEAIEALASGDDENGDDDL